MTQNVLKWQSWAGGSGPSKTNLSPLAPGKEARGELTAGKAVRVATDLPANLF